MTSTRTEMHVLRRAAARANLAPSVHNTQPWRFVVTSGSIEIHGDPARQLQVLDPSGRQLTISCGCAVLNARAAIAADGFDAVVTRVLNPTKRDRLARITLGERAARWRPIAALDQVIELRRSNRRKFAPDAVPLELVYELMAAAAAEESELFPVATADHRATTAALSRQADAAQNADPAYRSELRAWTTDDPQRPDGVLSTTVPWVNGLSGDDLPIRDFDTRGTGALPAQTRSTLYQSLFILGTRRDDRYAWLRAGEALQRLWLEATRRGYTASLLTQVVEVPSTREALRHELNLPFFPHILIRIGRAEATPATRRRALSEVLLEGAAETSTPQSN